MHPNQKNTQQMRENVLLAFSFLLTLLNKCDAFYLPCIRDTKPMLENIFVPRKAFGGSRICMQAQNEDLSRRLFLIAAASSLLASKSQASDSANIVTVIGASGYTGGDVVRSLSERGIVTRAVSRSTTSLSGLNSKTVKSFTADVTVPKTLPVVIQGSSSVIFLASARKGFESSTSDESSLQTYEDVDHLGLVNVAKTCIEKKVQRLVVVSSSCVSCNEAGALESSAKIDKATGLKCSQCQSKRSGEEAIRELYAQANDPSLGYTIVRVGYLTTGEKRGVSHLELNQGESKTGIISRLDLAELAIEASMSSSAKDSTFECYYRDTAQPVDIAKSLAQCRNLGKSTQECFFGGSFKDRGAPSSLDEALSIPVTGTLFASGNERSGNSWPALFQGLQPDRSEGLDLSELGFGQS